MSKRSRSWSRRQRKAIRRRTTALRVSEIAAIVLAVAKFPRIGGTFVDAAVVSDLGDLFAVRPRP